MKRAFASLVALLVLSCAGAENAAVPATVHPLKIGIIGTGEIGGALARHWGAAGHLLMISSRHPGQLQSLAREIGSNVKVGTPREAAAFGDLCAGHAPLPGHGLFYELSIGLRR